MRNLWASIEALLRLAKTRNKQNIWWHHRGVYEMFGLFPFFLTFIWRLSNFLKKIVLRSINNISFSPMLLLNSANLQLHCFCFGAFTSFSLYVKTLTPWPLNKILSKHTQPIKRCSSAKDLCSYNINPAALTLILNIIWTHLELCLKTPSYNPLSWHHWSLNS